jgi:hypothetical protein
VESYARAKGIIKTRAVISAPDVGHEGAHPPPATRSQTKVLAPYRIWSEIYLSDLSNDLSP